MSRPPETDPLLVTREGHVQWWTLNLPEQRNPITGADMVSAFEQVVASVNSDPEIRCVVLTGAGPAFCAGGNIKAMAAGEGYFGAQPAGVAQGYRSGIQRVTRAMMACEVPIIAAVNGPAVGAGCDLAMMCDLRIASGNAMFAESFVKLGLIPGDGGAWLLPRIIGHARASQMALTGDPVAAHTALEWGMVYQVVSREELSAAAAALAAQVAANPPVAVRMTKALLRDAASQTLDQVLATSASMQAIAHHTADHRTALRNMLERRDDPYQGR